MGLADGGAAARQRKGIQSGGAAAGPVCGSECIYIHLFAVYCGARFTPMCGAV